MIGRKMEKLAWILVIINICFIVCSLSSAINRTCGSGVYTGGYTYPVGDIIVHEGYPLNILCILNDDDSTNISSRDLVFFRNNERLPDSMIDIVNSTTIQLHIENMESSNVIYYCKLKNSDKGICLNKVAVGLPPQPATSFECTSQNWDNLTCTWTVPINHVKTKYELFYKLKGRASKGHLHNCPAGQPVLIKEQTYRCFWNLSTDPHYRQTHAIYNFTLKGVNKLGKEEKHYEFKHYERVIPNPPTQLKVLNKTTESIMVEWKLSGLMDNFPPGVTTRLSYRSPFDQDWKVLNLSTLLPQNQSYTYNITDLKYAHAIYDIRVQLRSNLSFSENMWSNNASLVARTQSKKPSIPPKTDIGSFEVDGNIDYRNVYVYWQQIPEYLQNGVNFSYKVQVHQDGFVKQIRPNETTNSYAKFTNLNYHSYTFDIYSSNSEGNSSTSSQIYLPSLRENVPEPLSFSKIAYNNNDYELSWKPPSHPHPYKITSYTLFWCKNEKDRPYQCEGYLQWEHVAANITILNKTVTEGTYQFAISANTEKASSGMVWASCTIIFNKYVGKMKNVWVKVVGATHIEMGWKLDCSDRIGVVTGYKIYYCPIKSPQNLTCIDSVFQNITVRGDLNTMNGNVTNLKPYTTYKLAISVLTDTEESLMSDFKFNTTLETAPAVPTNVKIAKVTNSSISLTWDPPKDLNGMFRNYVIKYNNEEEKVEGVNNTNTTLKNLKSYVNYDIKIGACTLKCSYADVIRERTLPGYPDVVETPMINFLNKSRVSLYWPSPKDPRGPISFYELQIDRKKDGVVDTEFSNTTREEVDITLNCEMEHSFRVRAINVDEKGQLLQGNWSPIKKVPCDEANQSHFYIYFIILFIVISVVLSFGVKSCWQRCKAMSDVEVKLPPGLTSMGDDNNINMDLSHYQPPLSGLSTNPLKDSSRTDGLHHIASDEQLLLEKKEDTGLDQNINNGESSGCSSGNESISSSLASVPISNVACNVSDSGTEHALNTDNASVESGSLRLRNVGGKMYTADTGHLTSGQKPWTKGYITMPNQQEKAELISVGRNKPPLPASGYCQVGKDNVISGTSAQSLTSPGYVPVPLIMNKPSSESNLPTLNLMPYETDTKKSESIPDNLLTPDSDSSGPKYLSLDLIDMKDKPLEAVQVIPKRSSPYIKLGGGEGPRVVKEDETPYVKAPVSYLAKLPSPPTSYLKVGLVDTGAVQSPSGQPQRAPGESADSSKSRNPYVTHRQLDCKLLKED